jgi:osmotically-inducible protein OsmY
MTSIYNRIALFLSITIFLMVSGCVPVFVGGMAGSIGTAAVKKKGLGGSITDTGISMRLRLALRNKSQDLSDFVKSNVQNRQVLLYGAVINESMKEDAEQVAWDIEGVFDVKNHIIISNDIYDASAFKDAAITTQIKGSLLSEENLPSMNYSIITYRGVVYVMGIAGSKDELEKVLTICRNKSGVTRVVDHVVICERPVRPSREEMDENSNHTHDISENDLNDA